MANEAEQIREATDKLERVQQEMDDLKSGRHPQYRLAPKLHFAGMDDYQVRSVIGAIEGALLDPNTVGGARTDRVLHVPIPPTRVGLMVQSHNPWGGDPFPRVELRVIGL